MPVLAETATAVTNSTLITSLTEGLKTVAADMTTSLSSVYQLHWVLLAVLW